MIISASRRTDVGAFYSKWLMDCLNQGYVDVKNPFNQKLTRVDLSPDSVDAIVFWTRNPEPMLKYLDLLEKKGYRFYFQVTINNYSEIFEPCQPEITRVLESFKVLSGLIGAERVIWRYDPIIYSSLTDFSWHAEKYGWLAENLQGFTRRCVISFLDVYPKVKKRLASLQEVEVYDFEQDEQDEFVCQIGEIIAKISGQSGIEVFTCAEKISLDKVGIKHGACVDAKLIEDVFNLKLPSSKDKGQRKECFCALSKDIGTYNTCHYKCVYCYANNF